MSNIPLLALRTFSVFLSFAGCCAGIRSRWKIDPFVAPILAASGQIVLLMFSGMLGILQPCMYVLFACGFIGLLYAYFIKRTPPHWLLLGVGLLFTAFLAWRFFPCTLKGYDDFSHWGLAARHLLLYNRFPGANDLITFQSYPLGASCFVYYFSKIIGNFEGAYLFASNFLLGALFCPAFSIVRRHKKLLDPIAALLFALFLNYSCVTANLGSDLMQILFGIGMAAVILRYRNDFRKALVCVLLPLIAVVYVKNSGMYFSFCTCGMLIVLMKRNHAYSKRRAWIVAALPLLAFGLWFVYIYFHFPSALSTKHAISPLKYARRLYHLNIRFVLALAKSMLVWFFQPRTNKSAILILGLFCLIALFPVTQRQPAATRRKYYRACAATVAAYLAWFLLLFGMYVFSMPANETKMLAGIARYDSTGGCYTAGIIVLLLLSALDDCDALTSLFRRMAAGLTSAVAVAALVFSFVDSKTPSTPGNLFIRDLQPSQVRVAYQKLHETREISPNKNILYFCPADYGSWDYIHYVSKYELQTSNLTQILSISDKPGQFAVRNNTEIIDDLESFLVETVDTVDEFIVFDATPEFMSAFDAFQAEHPCEIPVFFIETGND